MTADVDIVLPVFNGARYLSDAIRSIQAQTLSSWRLFVVDNGSTDGTPTIIRSFAEKDSRIVPLRLSSPDLVGALNLAIDRCTARYIARCDGDDISMPDRLQKQVQFLNDHASCIAVSGGMRRIDEDGNEFMPPTMPPARAVGALDRLPAVWPYAAQPFLMVRAESLRRIGGYRQFAPSEDVDLSWRLSDLGEICNLQTIVGAYRSHEASQSWAASRIQAVAARLADIAAKRRRAGTGDLSGIPPHLAAGLRSATSFAEIFPLLRPLVSADEYAYLEFGTAVRLLQRLDHPLAKLDVNDARFIRQAFRKFAVTHPEYEAIAALYAQVKAKLLAAGNVEAALALSGDGQASAD